MNIAEPDSRAQIILVGAVAIAFILLGIVIVFNTSLYAENVDATGTVSSVNHAEQLEHVGGQTVAGLAYRVNQDTYDLAGVKTAMAENVSNVSGVWQTLAAESGPTLLNLSFDESASEYGVRVYQNDGDDFNHSDGTTKNWALATESDSADVAEFEMQVVRADLNDAPDGAFHIAVRGTNETGDEKWRVLWFYTDGSGNLQVDVRNGTAPAGSLPGDWANQTGDGSPECDVSVPTDVTIDVTNGSVEGTRCFPFVDGIENLSGGEGYELRFNDANNVTGDYSLVLSNGDHVSTAISRGGDQPNYSDIVWAAGVTVQYESASTSYRRTTTVPVYTNSTR